MQTTCSTEPSSASGRCCTISVDRPVVPKPIWNDQWSHWSNANDLFHPPNLLEYPALRQAPGPDVGLRAGLHQVRGGGQAEEGGGGVGSPPCTAPSTCHPMLPCP